MPSELALPPDGISIFHKSQYFSVSPFKIYFYVGHVNSIWNYWNYILPSVGSKQKGRYEPATVLHRKVVKADNFASTETKNK